MLYASYAKLRREIDLATGDGGPILQQARAHLASLTADADPAAQRDWMDRAFSLRRTLELRRTVAAIQEYLQQDPA